MVDIPVERYDRLLSPAKPIEPDTWRPTPGRSTVAYDGALDDLHVDATRTQRVRSSAWQSIERNLAPTTAWRLFLTGGRRTPRRSSPATSVAAVDRFLGRKLPSITANKNDQYGFRQALIDPTQRVDDPDDMERAHNAQSMSPRCARWPVVWRRPSPQDDAAVQRRYRLRPDLTSSARTMHRRAPPAR